MGVTLTESTELRVVQLNFDGLKSKLILMQSRSAGYCCLMALNVIIIGWFLTY